MTAIMNDKFENRLNIPNSIEIDGVVYARLESPNSRLIINSQREKDEISAINHVVNSPTQSPAFAVESLREQVSEFSPDGSIIFTFPVYGVPKELGSLMTCLMCSFDYDAMLAYRMSRIMLSDEPGYADARNAILGSGAKFDFNSLHQMIAQRDFIAADFGVTSQLYINQSILEIFGSNSNLYTTLKDFDLVQSRRITRLKGISDGEADAWENLFAKVENGLSYQGKLFFMPLVTMNKAEYDKTILEHARVSEESNKNIGRGLSVFEGLLDTMQGWVNSYIDETFRGVQDVNILMGFKYPLIPIISDIDRAGSLDFIISAKELTGNSGKLHPIIELHKRLVNSENVPPEEIVYYYAQHVYYYKSLKLLDLARVKIDDDIRKGRLDEIYDKFDDLNWSAEVGRAILSSLIETNVDTTLKSIGIVWNSNEITDFVNYVKSFTLNEEDPSPINSVIQTYLELGELEAKLVKEILKQASITFVARIYEITVAEKKDLSWFFNSLGFKTEVVRKNPQRGK